MATAITSTGATQPATSTAGTTSTSATGDTAGSGGMDFQAMLAQYEEVARQQQREQMALRTKVSELASISAAARQQVS